MGVNLREQAHYSYSYSDLSADSPGAWGIKCSSIALTVTWNPCFLREALTRTQRRLTVVDKLSGQSSTNEMQSVVAPVVIEQQLPQLRQPPQSSWQLQQLVLPRIQVLHRVP